MITLREDEEAILRRSGRCRMCAHLIALHTRHCCTFCDVCSDCNQKSFDTACEEGRHAECEDAPLFEGPHSDWVWACGCVCHVERMH